MPIQSEAALEEGLIAALRKMNYEYVQNEELVSIHSYQSLRFSDKSGYSLVDVVGLKFA